MRPKNRDHANSALIPGRRQGRHLGLAVTAALVTMAAVAASTAAAAPAPKLNWRDCARPAQKGFQCATARAPRNYSHPHRSKIHLAVIRHRATDPTHRIGTLFFNPGGPGRSKASFPDAWVPHQEFFPPALRARFDVVTWDPRGTGGSAAVQCFASQKDESRFLDGVGFPGQSFPFGKAEKRKWIRRYQGFGHRCGRTNGGLLRHVSTADTARDLNLLRRSVGDRRLSYWGVSYGTFLGATFANLFPNRVRALVLDGNVNPRALVHRRLKANDGLFLSTELRQHSDQGTVKTLDAFLGLCGRTDTAHCAFSAGSATATRDKYDVLLRRLRTDPASADISYADLTSQIFQGLVGLASWPGAAECLQDVWTSGRWCPSASPSTLPIPGTRPAGADQATGTGQRYAGPEQLLAILCSESPNPRRSAFWALDVFANQRSGAAGRYKSWITEPCASWPASAADRYAGPWNRRTANPLLVIGNTHDPNTPHRSSVAMSRQLARARLLTLEGYGHTSGNDPSACIRKAVSAYLTHKVLPPKGTRCQPDEEPFGVTP
jgi:pimeloyl-ACP methyl ester carboxylesterase